MTTYSCDSVRLRHDLNKSVGNVYQDTFRFLSICSLYSQQSTLMLTRANFNFYQIEKKLSR